MVDWALKTNDLATFRYLKQIENRPFKHLFVVASFGVRDRIGW